MVGKNRKSLLYCEPMRRCEGLVDASQRARNITAQKIDKIMAETEGDEEKIPKKLTVAAKYVAEKLAAKLI